MSQQGVASFDSSMTIIQTLTGNSGGAVSPDGAGNIDVLGNNSTGIDIVGTPGSFLLTVIGLAASTTQVGTIGIATDAEVTAGVVTDEAVVPSSLAVKLGTQTQYAIPIGEGSSANFNWTSAGTDGQLLIAATGADPDFASLTSTGSTITITPGANTLNIDAATSIATSYTCDSGSAVPAANVLTVTGSGGLTTSGAGSTITIVGTGEQLITVTAVNSSPYVVLSTDYYLSVDCSGGAIQINMPNAPSTGKVFIVKDSTGSAASFNITVTTVGGVVTIDGSTTFVMNTAYEAAQFVFNGTSYEVF